LGLTSCATPSSPIEVPKPLAVDPRVCASLEKEPPVQGGLIQPATEAERLAVADFLNSIAEIVSWGRRGWERSDLAKRQAC
jgi:hypothetical protein